MALIGVFFADLLYRRKPGMADQVVDRAREVSWAAGEQILDEPDLQRSDCGSVALPFALPVVGGLPACGVINGGGGAAAGSVRGVGALVQRVQSGNIRSYAGWLAVGAAALLLITYFGFSMHL